VLSPRDSASLVPEKGKQKEPPPPPPSSSSSGKSQLEGDAGKSQLRECPGVRKGNDGSIGSSRSSRGPALFSFLSSEVRGLRDTDVAVESEEQNDDGCHWRDPGSPQMGVHAP